MLTAVIIAVGTGTFAGLGGTSAWRLRSQDASYAALRYHDLRVRLPSNVDAPEGKLAAGIDSIADADQISATAERLIVPTQVDASTDRATVLVPGEIVGLDPDATVDLLHVASGRAAKPGEDERYTVYDVETETEATFSRQSAKSKRTVLNRPLPRWARYAAGVILLLDDAPGVDAVICGDEAAGVRYEHSLGVAFTALMWEMLGLSYDERALVDFTERVRREYVETS